ncbi:MAG TPA: FG-GAP and VCBS repeat-containing protein [Planctomycetota bacterium]|nr:FG-GAP and VCBS repeat-containing protein [Planctomycetota bacterium]
MTITITLAALVAALLPAADPKPLPLRAVTIDSKVGIGYGVAVADMDGDKKPDIILVDKAEVIWYRNPSWEKIVIAEKLTDLDHVAVAARDIDGDGKAEVAVGAGWNPGDTVGSGSVHYLVPPADRAGRWEPVKLPHEPTVHRMRWVRGPKESWGLLVVPLHGRGNRNAEGVGVKSIVYTRPPDPRTPWAMETASDEFHVTHNLDPVQWDEDPEEEVLLAAREGVFLLDRAAGKWTRTPLSAAAPGDASFRGAGEVRGGKLGAGRRFFAAVEPFHGNKVAIYTPPGGAPGAPWVRKELDDSLNEGHAVACGDLAGIGRDQVLVGWRRKDRDGKVGIKVYTPLDDDGKEWSRSLLDDNTMACEDLCIADLDGNGRLDVIAAGRDTHNLKVYWNEGAPR